MTTILPAGPPGAAECARVTQQREYPVAKPDWWYSIVTGLPERIVVDGFIEVWNRPGLGIDFDRPTTAAHLLPEDEGFFS